MQISTAPGIPTLRLSLEYAGSTHPIHRFPFVLGRARECDLVLSGEAVSRRHAAIVELRGEIAVEDLGSRNGLLVNARKVRGRSRVGAGDTLLLGNETLFVSTDRGAVTIRPQAKTERPAPAPLEPTAPLEAFALFTSAVDRALLGGRVDDAERLFALHIGRPLERGTLVDPDPETLDTVALVALRLAEASRNDAWLDFTLRVYASRSRPMPLAVVSGLCALVAKLRGIDTKLLGSYVSAMNARSTLTPEQRRVLDRLRGLESVAKSHRTRPPPAPRAGDTPDQAVFYRRFAGG